MTTLRDIDFDGDVINLMRPPYTPADFEGLVQNGIIADNTSGNTATPVVRYNKPLSSKRSSNLKAKNFSRIYNLAITDEKDYAGSTYSYKVFKQLGYGLWSAFGVPIAWIDLGTKTLSKVLLPTGTENLIMPVQTIPNVQVYRPLTNITNYARFLWRALGLNAVRYRDKTRITSLDKSNSVLIGSGESFLVPRAYSPERRRPKEVVEMILSGGQSRSAVCTLEGLMENIPGGNRPSSSDIWLNIDVNHNPSISSIYPGTTIRTYS